MSRVIFSIDDENCRLLPVYITGAAVDYAQEASLREGGLPDYQLTLCVGGEGYFKCGGKAYDIRPGTLFFYAPQVPTEYYPARKGFTVHWLTFNGSGAPGLAAYLELGGHKVIPGCPPLMASLFEQCHAALARGRHYACFVLLCRLLQELRTLCAPPQEPAGERGRMDMRAVMSQIAVDYGQDLTLTSLAESAGVSESYLCRIFKARVRMTPIEYLNKIRIQKAKEFLVNEPALTVVEVAARVGFHDAGYFCHVFKRLEGTTPTLFRLSYLPGRPGRPPE